MNGRLEDVVVRFLEAEYMKSKAGGGGYLPSSLLTLDWK
jgi:hypothetical protein